MYKIKENRKRGTSPKYILPSKKIITAIVPLTTPPQITESIRISGLENQA
jgi:hypothetical protein